VPHSEGTGWIDVSPTVAHGMPQWRGNSPIGQPDGFCKLIVGRRSHAILGAYVLGEYSAETGQVVATAMSAGMNVGQLAEMQFAFPTFTEAVGSLDAEDPCAR
jgi:pyruvate/2-oxoglutarate dehydrogenase complex dihydrolipoamide dehydrogenase (E3) component